MTSFARELTRLETESGGRLGVAAFDTGRKIQLSYRGNERFPMCSTFKVLAASSILARDPALLSTRIRYAKEELVTYSPVTEKHVADGMTNAELCAAALQQSDNTAGNLLMKQARRPGRADGVCALAAATRCSGWTAGKLSSTARFPGDPRDTTTPLAMMRTLQKLALGDALPPAPRKHAGGMDADQHDWC